MEFHQFVVSAVSFVGFILIFKPILSFLKWVWVMFLRPAKNLKDYGSWAIITGATDGIGKALAFELASKGLSLVLVGRNPEKLELTYEEIRQKHEVDIRTVVIDLAKSSGQDISRAIEDGIEGLDIGILINNAGVAFPYARFFHEVDSELMMSVMKVNIDGLTWVTRSVLPVMLSKKKGAIVNIGSGSSVVLSSYPLFSIYAATKAYLAMFSRCIYLEYKQKGIDVQCQVPLFVATKMSKFKRSSFFIPSAEMYSKASIRWIGYDHLCLPYWPHSLQWFALHSLPDALVTRFIFNYLLGTSKKGLQKDSIGSPKLA
ncbi:Very-long-chain 3-oxoacyl-CoA reductase 1-like [Melia azedarach]|uniref:Very-long-chain 3-oxoacyl-CoA reductase 1-like n=1 Tax=Melia azedarach TaxID=155640 RepID=A0ACC1XI27_MELAZ|nr:Very-long-chain 3-oxoacyl-CoA reductase 1-like [Melia azedarach]